MSASCVREALRNASDPEKAKALRSFFKTGRGGYGEGDHFLGVKVPDQRKVAKEFRDLSVKSLRSLIKSRTHEERLTALLIIVLQYQRCQERRDDLFELVVSHRRYVNNWDLVDTIAPKVIGAHLLNRNKGLLTELALSDNLWSRRMAIISTLAFIQAGKYSETLRLAKKLISDKEDLIQKAVGWMLREVGKRDQNILRQFLDAHAERMPRTMLRYAIEKFSTSERKFYLQRYTLKRFDGNDT